MSNNKKLKICVLQPDYSTSTVDYRLYDPARNLSGLILNSEVDHVFLNKLTTYKQLKALSKKNYDIFINLCEGYLDWEIPSIDVVYFLETLNLPFTGPTSVLYDPPKELMKYVAYTAGVKTPPFAIINAIDNLESSCMHLRYPLFVKPSAAGDSLGIDQYSLVNDKDALLKKVASIIDEYGEALVEEYIDGREFTVLLVADARDNKSQIVFDPIEYNFPSGNAFKTYSLKTSELHPNANVPVFDKSLAESLKDASSAIFSAFCGAGYARLDFRMNDRGELFFLEINFTCSVFYENGYEGSADYILKYSNISKADFLQMIIDEGIERHKKKQKKYTMKGNSISGYGIYANKDIEKGEVVFQGEGRSQKIATLNYIRDHWTVKELENFRKYAYPLSKEVFLLWDENPAEWAPQNHSCEANTEYFGLDVVASRLIKKDEELTLDYALFLDDTMEPFECSCGTPSCKGLIKGTKENSVSLRERKKNI